MPSSSDQTASATAYTDMARTRTPRRVTGGRSVPVRGAAPVSEPSWRPCAMREPYVTGVRSPRSGERVERVVRRDARGELAQVVGPVSEQMVERRQVGGHH